MKGAVIAVVGNKKSGKTTVIEALTRELTRRGYGVAAVKHISEPDFTLDTVGKDTWRFARSGAETVVGVSSAELVTIERMKPNTFSLKLILQRCKGNDIVFLEGFRELVAKKRNVYKIVVVKSADEALEAAKTFRPILAFAGPYATSKLKLGAPYVDALRNAGEMANIVETAVRVA